MVKEANYLGSSPFYHFPAVLPGLALSFLICELGQWENLYPNKIAR